MWEVTDPSDTSENAMRRCAEPGYDQAIKQQQNLKKKEKKKKKIELGEKHI